MKLTVGIFIQGLYWAQSWAGMMESDETPKEVTESRETGGTDAQIPYHSNNTRGQDKYKKGPENDRPTASTQRRLQQGRLRESCQAPPPPQSPSPGKATWCPSPLSLHPHTPGSLRLLLSFP